MESLSATTSNSTELLWSWLLPASCSRARKMATGGELEAGDTTKPVRSLVFTLAVPQGMVLAQFGPYLCATAWSCRGPP